MGGFFEALGNAGERVGSGLYPYRYAVAAAVVLVATGAIAWAARCGVHRSIQRHPWRFGVGAALAAVVLGPVLFYLGSPLFTRSELREDSPLVAATPVMTAVTPRGASPMPSLPPLTPPATETSAPASPETAETATPPTMPSPMPFAARVVASGEFRGADDFHFGRGTAILIESEPGVYTIRFEGFSVRNGPDLFLYLSPDPAGYADGAINIGELRATDGDYNNPVPAGTDVASARSVLIWCRQFAVLFAVAELTPAP